MTSQEEKTIKRWHDGLSSKIEISFILTEDERSTEFREFSEELSNLASKLSINTFEDNENELPAIKFNRNLYFHAIPLGTELEPFLEALTLLGGNSIKIPGTIQDQLDKIKMPAELKLYIAKQCPFCPITVKQLIPLTFANDLIKLEIIDGTLFPEIAEMDNIKSAPTLLLDENFRWTGTTNLNEIVEIVLNRNPSNLSTSSIIGLLKEGGAAQVAEMMLENNSIFPAFINALINEKWPVRLGAMVAFEYIAEKNKSLASRIINPMWEHFQRVEDQIKGDIIYILGETGNIEMVPELEKISYSGIYHEEVKDAARDALKKIEQKTAAGV
ncbi:MAG: thioredoxin family protein [Desulfobacterales bacterium]|nr:thioredoxin family protein [Desulfobacterales bacterium]